jgi:hypothetical protein
MPLEKQDHSETDEPVTTHLAQNAELRAGGDRQAAERIPEVEQRRLSKKQLKSQQRQQRGI